MRPPVYLDNNSTTKVDPRVVDAMMPFFLQNYGNAASRQHQFGWTAEAAVEIARSQVASLIGADPTEIIFTSGATESINLALKGIAESYRPKGNHIIAAAAEHRAVLDTCRRLERLGFDVRILPVDRDGAVLPEDVEDALTEKTIMVTVMMANNEIGTVSPVAAIGHLCRAHGVIFHTDATQAVGKLPVNVLDLQVDLMSFSAHKMYGPKGIGALYVRNAQPRLHLSAQADGGGHERGLRSGTVNVPAVVGFGKAAAIAATEMDAEAARTRMLRDALLLGMTSRLQDVRLNGHPVNRLPNNLNLTFDHVRADALMMMMKDVAVSSGSACSSASPEPSHVLRALGLSPEEVLSSLRFGVGRFTTEEEVEYAVKRVVETVTQLREKKNT